MRAGAAICEDLARHGLDPDALCASLEGFGVPAAIVAGPCGRAGALGPPGWDRVVLGVCPEGPGDEEVRARARRSGADAAVGAASVDTVAVSSFGPEERRDKRAATVLRARLAGLAAASPSPPDGFRIALPAGRVSRRSLLSSGGVRYLPVATVGQVGCRGSAACGLCVEACPVGAIHRGGRVPEVDRGACVGCARCVSACPVEGAVRLPGADLVRFEAELEALTAGIEGPGLAVVCARSGPEGRLAGTWLPVEVPCLSIVTPSWALSALAAGARAVAFSGCGASCAASAAERVGATVEFARAALALAGVADPQDRVRLLLPEDQAIPTGRDPVDLPALGIGTRGVSLREPAASVSALASLGAVAGTITGEGAPFGRVAFDAERCTMCGVCAGVCPTGAIRFDQGAVAATLDLVRAACIGCGHCATICPEGALSVDRGVDLEDLGTPPEPLKRSPLARCLRCGEPVAPTAMLDRLRPMLDHAMLRTIEGLCQGCRGTADRVPAT